MISSRRKRPALWLVLFLCTQTFLTTPVSSLNTPIITCASSIEQERAFSFFCRPGDRVLELGAQFSDASRRLCATTGPSCGKALLVDIARSDTKSGRSSTRNVEFFQSMEGVEIMELPSLEEWKDVIFRSTTKRSGSIIPSEDIPDFDIVSIDLGHMIGNDLYLSALSLAHDILSMTTPRVVIVKSQSLTSLSRRLIPAQHVVEGNTLSSSEAANKVRRVDDTQTKKKDTEPYILAAVGVEEYRRLIPVTVNKNDTVLEVGCHFGRSTQLLSEAGACAYGIDIGPKIIKNAQAQYPDITFAVADAWKTLDLLRLRNDGILGYDVVYADIGGLSGPHGTLEALSLLDALANALEPRCIVIKSLCMKRLASQLRPFQSIWAKKGNKKNILHDCDN